MGFTQAALLAERCEVEIFGVDAEAGGDVVADEVEPGDLFACEFYAALEWQFAKRDTLCRVEVHLRLVLNDPAATSEDGVDLLAGFFFGCHMEVDLPQQA